MKNIWKILIVIAVVLIIIWLYYEHYVNQRPQKQQLLVIRNYNPEAGFHWMGVHNVIVASNEAKKRNLKLVVLMDSGLYLEKNPKHQEEYQEFVDKDDNNWFNYYFTPVGTDDEEVNKLWKQGKLDKLPSYMWYNMRKNTIGYDFDRKSYEKADKKIDFSKGFSDVIKLKPYLKEKVQEFYNKNMKGKFLIGIHARGTDKFSSVDSHENNPKHFTYQQYCDAIEKEILIQQKLQNKPIAVLACSDEQPFIDYIKQCLGNKYEIISAEGIIRSNISTSGINILCEDDNPECKHYKDNSIHRGMSNESNYKKGLDAIYEVSLLAKCDVFYASRGNFSNAVNYINPNNKKVDMVSTFN